MMQEEREAASDQPSEPENMVDEIGSFQFLPILTQVFGSTQNLSDRMIPDSLMTGYNGNGARHSVPQNAPYKPRNTLLEDLMPYAP